MTDSSHLAPAGLRSAIARYLSPVRALRPPLVRSMALLPIGLVLLVAAPVVFSFRDLETLGWPLAWGASALQIAIGMLLIAAALREAVPGRAWSPVALTGLFASPLALVIAVTLASWSASPVALPRLWWTIGGICFAGSFISAIPAVALAAVLALRAYPTRPAVAGGLAGLGAGLMADAGWRLFCHYSEPAHVLTAHLAGVLVPAVLGALATARVRRNAERRTLSSSL